jgi:hypothetical protein
VDIELVKGALYESDDPAVTAAPSLFAPVAESTDAEVKALKAELAEMKELITSLAKPTAAAKKAAEKELKGDVA